MTVQIGNVIIIELFDLFARGKIHTKVFISSNTPEYQTVISHNKTVLHFAVSNNIHVTPKYQTVISHNRILQIN